MILIIAIDNSVYALKAANYGLRLAQQLNAKPLVLFVIEKTKELGNIELGVLPNEAKTTWHKDAQRQLENIKLENPDSEFEKLIIDGDPQKDIIRICEEYAADLIVVGSHGDTGIISRLVGSVTKNLIEKAPVPVLVVTPNSNHKN